MLNKHQPDIIIYSVVTLPGGVDGLDTNAKGGKVVFASFDKACAVAKVDCWTELKSEIVQPKEVIKAALTKLSPVEKLLLSLDKTC